MAIEYTEEKRFTVEQVEALFKSVGWESAQWPERLFKALQHSDTVISAWDGGHLVGLVRVLDDTENGGLYALGAGRSGISRAAYRQPSR